MSSSPRMDDLFAAARDDAPSSNVRDRVWGRVAAVTAAPIGAAAVKAAAPTGVKLVAAGAVIGAVSTAVVAIMLFSPRSADVVDARAGQSSAVNPPTFTRESNPASVASARVQEPALPASSGDTLPPEPKSRAGSAVSAPSAPAAATIATGAGVVPDEASILAREASLVTEARMALVHGEPERALALVRSTRRLPARALEPEELALEARALRALGRTDEALATELTLRGRFPDHALSR